MVLRRVSRPQPGSGVQPLSTALILDSEVVASQVNTAGGFTYTPIHRLAERIHVTPPSTPRFIDPSQNRRVRESSYTVKGKADPGVLVTLLAGSTAYTTVAGNYQGWWEVPVTLVEGENVLKAKARDDAGNESPFSDALTLTLDQVPPEIEAAVSPLWQRTGQPVTITAVVTETDPLYRGDVWAEVAGPDPATRYLAPGNPWQTTFTGGQEGPYTATVRAKDRAGNVATGEEKGFTLDSTPPDLALTLVSAPPFGYIVTDSIYYGDGSGVFTLTAVVTDTLAGLFSLAFPEATDAGATYGLGGATAATQAHPYAFETNDTLSTTLTVTATDRAGNQTTQPFHVMEDTGTPTVTIQVPTVAPLRFWISWSGHLCRTPGAGRMESPVCATTTCSTRWAPVARGSPG
jgi:hypothetical protein